MDDKKFGSIDPAYLVEQRQVENEAAFRKANEDIKKSLDELAELARKEGEHPLAPSPEMVIHFVCECSDEDCHERIAMTLGSYEELHEDRRNFIVAPGHETLTIESIVKEKTRFSLVKKFFRPPEKGVHLKSTHK